MSSLAESLAQHPGAWLIIIVLGCYHGINPAMGWLFAVSNGMQARRSGAVFFALPAIAVGHLLAMAVALLPFALLSAYLERTREISLAAGLLLIGFGVYKLIDRRHPRFLARIGPSQLVFWSFLMATAHGAGLMLAPVYLGLCTGARNSSFSHRAMEELIGSGVISTSLVAVVHTLAMLLTAGLIAWLVYQYFGLRLLQRAWFNLDLLWVAFLIIVGATAVGMAW